MDWLGIDIGGANIKLADGRGFADAQPFALWKQPQRLAFELRTLIAHAPPCDHLAVAMTGELADCFATKAEGVQRILAAVAEASDRRHTRVYLSGGVLVSPQVATTRAGEAAAANWHALARFAGRLVGTSPALVIDVGSTTCDITPLVEGKVAAAGWTDTQRLIAGELLYTGVERSPVCAIVDRVPFRGQECRVAQEVFATTRDVYVLLDELPEGGEPTLTADGRPNQKAWARARLARMICADAEEFNHRDAVAVAKVVADLQAKALAQAVRQVAARMPVPPAVCVLAGHGEFLARRALDLLGLAVRNMSLGKELGPRVSRCATAHALAVLAREAVG